MHRIGKVIGCCLIAVSLRLHKPMMNFLEIL